MPLKMVRANLVDMRTDAIVNAANTGLKQGGGVCGAIFEAAGAAAMRKACDVIGGCATGEAVITPGFRLRAKYVIHTPGPVWAGGTHGEAELLAACYRNALALAQKRELNSIAFPLISAGIYGYPSDQALHVAVRAIGDYLLTHDDIEVYLVQYGQTPTPPDAPTSRAIWKYLNERLAESEPPAPETPPHPSHRKGLPEADEQQALPRNENTSASACGQPDGTAAHPKPERKRARLQRHWRSWLARLFHPSAEEEIAVKSGSDGISDGWHAENQGKAYPDFPAPAGRRHPEPFTQATDMVYEFRSMPAPEADGKPEPPPTRKASRFEHLDSFPPLQKRFHEDYPHLHTAPANAQPDSAAPLKPSAKGSADTPSTAAIRDDIFRPQGWPSSEPALTRREEPAGGHEARRIAADLYAARQAGTDAMRRNMQRLALEGVLLEKQDTFSEAVLRRIDEMHLKDPVVYRRANLDRKLFSKLRNAQSYSPSRRTALSLCVALELTLTEAYDLLSRAGYTLSVASDADLIVAYFIEHGWYDIFDLNEALFTFNQRCLGV